MKSQNLQEGRVALSIQEYPVLDPVVERSSGDVKPMQLTRVQAPKRVSICDEHLGEAVEEQVNVVLQQLS